MISLVHLALDRPVFRRVLIRHPTLAFYPGVQISRGLCWVGFSVGVRIWSVCQERGWGVGNC